MSLYLKWATLTSSSMNSPRDSDLSVRSSCLVALINWIIRSTAFIRKCSVSQMLLFNYSASWSYISRKVCWSISGYFDVWVRQVRYSTWMYLKFYLSNSSHFSMSSAFFMNLSGSKLSRFYFPYSLKGDVSI